MKEQETKWNKKKETNRTENKDKWRKLKEKTNKPKEQ